VTNTCPTCGSAIDPLRAPVARIVGGRILTYCSPACAEGATTVAKVTAAAADASAQSLKARPVEKKPDPKSEPRTEAKADARADAKVEPRVPTPTPRRIVEPEPEVEDHPRSATDIRRRRNRRVMWLSAGIITGGMAVAIIQTVSPSSPGRVDAERDSGAHVADAAPKPPPPPDKPPGLDPSDPVS
jgi:hypothetical protein